MLSYHRHILWSYTTKSGDLTTGNHDFIPGLYTFHFFYSPLCLRGIGIGKDQVHQSVQLDVRPCAFLHDGWMDFFHIGYINQVPLAIDTSKIEFRSVKRLCNYGNFFHKFWVSVVIATTSKWTLFHIENTVTHTLLAKLKSAM